jgi:hypothetical protein
MGYLTGLSIALYQRKSGAGDVYEEWPLEPGNNAAGYR